MRKPWTQAFLVVATLLLAACDQGRDPTKAQLRLINASGGYAELDLRVENELRQSRVGYGATASYVEVDPDDTDTTITSAGSPTPLLSFTPALSKKKSYAVLAYGEAGALRQALLAEDQGEPETGKALLRVVNASADAGSLDVYLTRAGERLQASVPVHSGATFGAVSGWITVNSDSWQLRVTAAGSKTDVRLDLGAVDLPSKALRTLVLTPSGGGVLVNALLIAQQGAIARLDGTQARVRLVAGVADGGTVSASVGGKDLVGSASPSLGDYELVPAGTNSLVVGVDGATAVTLSRTLNAGFDYTLLAYGPLAAPLAELVSDDNHLPTDGTRAKLRLVNGLPAAGGTLSMTLDLLPVARGVARGAASAYTVVGTTSGVGNGALSVAELGVPTPTFTAANQVIGAGGVYSVFVLGAQGTAVTGTLRKDR